MYRVVLFEGRGLGLEALVAVEAGVRVAAFDGPVVPWAEVPESEVAYAFQLDDDRWLIPKTDGRYANHACEPNCAMNDRFLVTRRPVLAQEELTIAYNLVDRSDPMYDRLEELFWDDRWSFDCRCGSVNCQGRVEGYRRTP